MGLLLSSRRRRWKSIRLKNNHAHTSVRPPRTLYFKGYHVGNGPCPLFGPKCLVDSATRAVLPERFWGPLRKL
jgi:hypothetical protein